MLYSVGDRVTVLSADCKEACSGSIIVASEHYCDVLLGDCSNNANTQKHVPCWRIQPLSNKAQATCLGDILPNLQAVLDDDNNEYSFTAADVMKLYRLLLVLNSDTRRAVSPALWDLVANKCCEWLRNEAGAVGKLSDSMTAYLNDVDANSTKQPDDVVTARSSINNSESSDSDSEANSDSILKADVDTAQAIIAAGYCVFYMLSNRLGNASLFTREIVEDIIQFPKQFLTVCNYLNTGVNTATSAPNDEKLSAKNQPGRNREDLNYESDEGDDFEVKSKKKARKKYGTSNIDLVGRSTVYINTYAQLQVLFGISFGDIVLSYLDILSQYLAHHRQYNNDRFLISCYESALHCLAADTSSVPSCIVVNQSKTKAKDLEGRMSPTTRSRSSPTCNNLNMAMRCSSSPISECSPGIGRYTSQTDSGSLAYLVKLHLKAGEILQLIYCYYKSHRRSILQDMLPILVEVYNGKSVIKSIPIHKASSGTEKELEVGLGFEACDSLLSGSSGCSKGGGERNLSTAFCVLINLIQGSLFMEGKPLSVNAVTAAESKSQSAAVNAKVAPTTAAVNCDKENIEESDMVKCVQLEIRHNCNMLISELFKRCVQKDVNAEYRKVTSGVVEELIACMSSPKYPGSIIILERLVFISVAALVNNTSNVGSLNKSNSGGNNSNLALDLLNGSTSASGYVGSSFTLFLLDILNCVGTSIRKMSCTNREAEKIAGIAYSKLDLFASEQVAHADTDSGHCVMTLPIKVSSYIRSIILDMLGELKSIQEREQVLKEQIKIKPKCKVKKGCKTAPKEMSDASPVCLVPPLKLLHAAVEMVNVVLDALFEHGGYGNVIPTSGTNRFTIPIISSILERLLQAFPELSWYFKEIHGNDIVMGTILQYYCTLDKGLYAFTSESSSNLSHDVNILVLLAQWITDRKASDVRMNRLPRGDAVLGANMLSQALNKSLTEFLSYAQQKQSRESVDAFNVNNPLPELLAYLTPKNMEMWRSCHCYEWSHHSYLQVLCSDTTVGGAELGFGSLIARQSQLSALFEHILHTLLIILQPDGTIGTAPPAVRSRVIKILCSYIDSDNELFGRDVVRESIIKTMYDNSTSVREEAVKLVGQGIIRDGGCFGASDHHVLGSVYVESLILKMKQDTGISVRRAIVSIFRDLLIKYPTHPKYAQICLVLFERASMPKEEESVKDNIQDMFQRMWFHGSATTAVNVSSGTTPAVNLNHVNAPASSAPTEMSTAAVEESVQARNDALVSESPSSIGAMEQMQVQMDISGSVNSEQPYKKAKLSVVTDVDAETVNVNFQPVASQKPVVHMTADSVVAMDVIDSSGVGAPSVYIPGDAVEAIALQMVDVVSECSCDQWITSLLRDVIHGRPDGDESKYMSKNKRRACYGQCEGIVSSLVELLLRCEEEQPPLVEMLKRGNRTCSQQIVFIIVTLSMFCEVQPTLLLPHMDMLLPYLKSYANSSISSASNPLSFADQCLISLKITTMLSWISVLPSAKNFVMARCEDIELDLRNIALKLNNSNVESAVVCMVNIAVRVTNNTNSILSLLQKCYEGIMSIIRHYENSPHLNSVSGDTSARLQRYLIVLGYACEHCSRLSGVWTVPMAPPVDTSDAVPRTTDANQITTNLTEAFQQKQLFYEKQLRRYASLSNEDVANRYHSCRNTQLLDRSKSILILGGLLYAPLLSGVCYAIAVYLLNFNVTGGMVMQLHSRAVQALCSIFVGNPALLIHCDNQHLLKQLFDPENEMFSDSVREKLLISLRRMLDTEESHMEAHAAQQLILSELKVGAAKAISGNGKRKTSVGMKVLGGGHESNEDGSANAGFVLQQHLHTITHYLCRSREVRLRVAALHLVGTLLRQGLICPLDVIAPLISLQGDHSGGLGMNTEPVLDDGEDRNASLDNNLMLNLGLELREISLKLLQVEDSRHPGFLENRLLRGMENTKLYQRSVCNNEGVSAIKELLFPSALDVFSANTMIAGNTNADENEEKEASVPSVTTQYASVFSGLFSTCIYGGQVTRLKRQDIHTSILRRSQGISQQFRSRSSTTIDCVVRGNVVLKHNHKTGKNLKKLHNPEIVGNVQVVSPQGTNSASASLADSLTTGIDVSGAASPVNKNSIPNLPAFEPITACIDYAESVYFLNTTLAHLPYEYYDDPLFLIYTINRNIPYQATVYVNEMKTILSGKWVAEETQTELASLLKDFANCISERVEGAMQPPVLGTNRGKMNATPQAQKSNWSQGLVLNESQLVKFAKKLKVTDVPLLVEFFACVALECRSLESFYRLKMFLKHVYALSDEKCCQYNPFDKSTSAGSGGSGNNEKIRNGSLVLSQVFTPLPIFNQGVILPIGVDLSKADINSLQMPFNVTPAAIDHIIATSDDPSSVCMFIKACVVDFNRLIAMCESDSSCDFKLNSSHTSQNKKKTKKMLVAGGNNIVGLSNPTPRSSSGCGSVSDDCDTSSVDSASPLTLPIPM